MARSKKAQAAIDGALSIAVPEEKVGLGVDIVDIARMRKIIERTPTFTKRMFSDAERAYCDEKADPAIHYAARFAAKEAVVKALGCGFTRGIHPRDIEVVVASGGKPEVKLSKAAEEVAQEEGIYDLPLSLSHTKNDAVACAIALTYGSKVATMKRKNPAEELAQQFKETRKILEEL